MSIGCNQTSLSFFFTADTLYETYITIKEKLMSDKKMFQAAGILWLVAALSIFVSLAISTQNDILRNFSDIEKVLTNSHASSTDHILGLVLDELSFFALIAVAAPLYIIFRRYDTTFALMGTLLLSAGGIVGAVNNVGYFAITQLGEMYVASTASEAAAIEAAALATITSANWGLMVSVLLISFGSIIFNYLIVFQSAGAKWLGWLGLLASGLVCVAAPIALNPSLEQVSYAFYLPFLIWEMAFGIWLLRRKK
jgi:hypothetical protein